jgi:hypothetical protein
VRRGDRFPGNQAQIVFSEPFIEYLEAHLTAQQREAVLVEVVALCANPAGSHPLSNRGSTDRLAGWNTIDVLDKEHRVVFASRVLDGVGLVEVLCAGPRRASAAYDLANNLIATGALTDDEVVEIWQALTLLDIVAEKVGLDGWDYRPPAAPDGLVRAAVASGVLDEVTARLLSSDEITAAMTEGWTDSGPDRAAALKAALLRARAGVDPGDITKVLTARSTNRCDAVLPRTGDRCVRKVSHPGAHRGR